MKYPRGTTLEFYCKQEKKNYILEQFDYEKNFPLTPRDFTKSTDKKAYFKYPCGHSVLNRIADKASDKCNQCSYCLNRSEVGNSLESNFPEIAKLFNRKKNKIDPNFVPEKSGTNYNWKCPKCNREWTDTVAHMTTRHRKCICQNKKISYPCHVLFFYLKFIDCNLELEKKINNFKFDLYSPEYKLAIEFDGYPWHNRGDNEIRVKTGSISPEHIAITGFYTLFLF